MRRVAHDGRQRIPGLVLAGVLVAAALPAVAQTKLELETLGLAQSRPLSPRADLGASPWIRTDQTEVRLVSATTAVGETARVRLGLQFRLKPGWKIYWRRPGVAGFPPRIDWSGSRNLREARLRWPAPKRFSVLGLDTMGYSGEVVLPIDAALVERGQPLGLSGKLDYLTCSEICVPYTAKLALDVPAGSAGATQHAHLIERFDSQVPRDAASAGFAIERTEIAPGPRGPTLRVEVRSPELLSAPDLFVEGPERVEFLAPEVRLLEGGRRARFLLAATTLGDDPPVLTDVPLTLTLIDGQLSMEETVRAVAGAPVADGDLARLLVILGLALLGGLILNLMPCVLPVLSIKLLHLVGHGGGERHRVRRGFVASAAGIIASFALLAAVLSALKAAGLAIGWGIQFQQPVFLIAMTLVLTLFAANLWGLFEIRLPGAVTEAALHASDEADHKSSLTGHFLTGAFATLLATPCSAPFLGTAVGFALSRGVLEIFAVFLALGVGLALPYLLIAAAPSIATRLPRPGRWMVVLKGVLGLALAATAAWLVTVLAAQTGAIGALAVAAAMVVAIGVLWLRHRLPEGRRWAGSAAVVAVAAIAFILPGRLAGQGEEAPVMEAASGPWRPFAPAAIPALVAEGEVVFVDVTADWCITCQANKKLVLNRGEVARRLGGKGVVAMRADWTRPSDEIAGYLASFDRYGIPFYAVYGPRAPTGLALPELLTSGIVLDALDGAALAGTVAER